MRTSRGKCFSPATWTNLPSKLHRPAPIAVSDAAGVRSLHIGGAAVQSAMRLDDPDALHLDYTRCMMACLLFLPAPREALLLGLGGGSIAKFLHRNFREARVRAVEVDPRVVAVARSQFGLPPDDARLCVEIGDGAMALAPECCDLLVVDAFHDEAPAVHLAGERFYAAAFASLASPGVMVANLMSDDPRLDERLQAIEGAFRGAVVCMPALTDPNVIAFGLKGYPPRIAWSELRLRARGLSQALDLPLARCVNALRGMNDCTAADLVVAGRI